MAALKTFRIKTKLAKKLKQNRPIPNWIRMRTGNTIRQEMFFRLLNPLIKFYGIVTNIFLLDKVDLLSKEQTYLRILIRLNNVALYLSQSLDYWCFQHKIFFNDHNQKFFSSTISLGVKNYRIAGLFWSKIFVIKRQKFLGIKKVNKCNEYC